MDIKKALIGAAASCAMFSAVSFAQTNEDYIKTFGMIMFERNGLSELKLDKAEFDAFVAGMKAINDGGKLPENIQEIGPKMMEYLRARAEANVAKEAEKAEAEAAEYWKELEKKENIIKTPSGCFGIDIYHRRGAELEPYLDFYASTHVHQDHRCDALADAMIEAGKPVLTNWLDRPGYSWTSTSAEDYEIGGFSIHTFITRHNNGDTNVPVTVFQISCGEDTDHFTLLHSGDSNFIADEYDVTADIDVYIPRYAPNALTENNVIGKVFSPDYVLLSHILELSHADPSVSRWTLEQGLERASELDCEKTYMPFWGETAIWKDGELNFNLYTE